MSFWNSTLIKKSRTIHRCEYCHAKIGSGQSYYRETGKLNDEFNDYALCLRCRALLISNVSSWNDDNDELGNFDEAFTESGFIKCPECGCTDLLDETYSENMLSVELTCEGCEKIYTVDLSADNLLKENK